MTTQQDLALATLQEKVSQMEAKMMKQEDYMDEVRSGLSRIEERLEGALRFSKWRGGFIGATVASVIGLAGVIVAWFRK